MTSTSRSSARKRKGRKPQTHDENGKPKTHPTGARRLQGVVEVGSAQQTPPEQTNAEEYYYLKQMAAKTPMIVILTDDQELKGWIEWYDKGAIKLNRQNEPNLLILKHNIRYMFKEEELKRRRRREARAAGPRADAG